MDIWEHFAIGFWHPFGPYTGLSVPNILEWKRSEIDRFGWTFWSFAFSRPDAWLDRIANVSGPVFVLCAHSPNAKDPDVSSTTREAKYFRCPPSNDWQPMPDPRVMKVTNPFKRRGLALGFKVTRVISLPPTRPPFPIEWYCKGNGEWREEAVPSRGEFLIRRGGSHQPRAVSAVLELAPPYLAVLSCAGT